MGLAIGLGLAISVGGGFLLDGWLGTSPALTLAGLAFGMIIAVLLVVSTVRTYL
jgi:hypothetical protein